jgi:hypothetical protein
MPFEKMSLKELRVEDHEFPDFIGQKLSEKQEWMWANYFHERAFPNWYRWLEARSIEPAELLPRTESRNTIFVRYGKKGLRDEFRDWRIKVKDDLCKLGMKSFNRRTANELSYWLCPFFDIEKKPLIVVESDILSSEAASHLPDDSRWVYFHPGLCFASDEDMEKKDLAKARDYEIKYPCPHQGALNKYRTFRGDKKQRENFFRDCDRLYWDSVRKGEQVDPEKEEAEAESMRIDDLLKRAKDFV